MAMEEHVKHTTLKVLSKEEWNTLKELGIVGDNDNNVAMLVRNDVAEAEAMETDDLIASWLPY